MAEPRSPQKEDSNLDFSLQAVKRVVIWEFGIRTYQFKRTLIQAQKPLVQLLDNGNLVLRDEKEENSENYWWQSFDYPSDTFLSGMKLGWERRNLSRHLSAWRSFNDPCNGDLTYGVEIDARLHTYPEVIMRIGSAKFYRAGAWNGVRFSGTPELRPNPNYDYWFCGSYGLCGANGNCFITETPVCQCLKGFKSKSLEEWNTMDWSDGWVNKSLNLEECRAKCLSNCSCMAYANSDVRGKGSGCVMWFGDLVDIRQYHSAEQDIYIRMLASDIERNGMQRSKSQDEDLDLPFFDLPTISTATNSFSENNKLGEGGFGPVYRGTLEGRQEIAVKILSKIFRLGVNEFKMKSNLSSSFNIEIL
ncbi:Tyrosine-protein kinase [Parasponia andersonii]|uniref:Tyrosine-protein kinase n=1 Tax=Parasponia andersonii TaxID=3476 RepID=A0A2P5BMC0_PARAD|nr:Tyrosine-protein kinase [Parasponia andersonii]